MKTSTPAEEILIRLWEQAGTTGAVARPAAELGLVFDDPHLGELVHHGLVTRRDDRVELTRAGWLAAARAARCQTLADLQPGQAGRVACLDTHRPGALRKLMAMGVLPGTSIQLVRRSPAFVFRVGYSEFAVDEGVAGAIYVRTENDESTAADAVRPPVAGWRWPFRRIRTQSCPP